MEDALKRQAKKKGKKFWADGELTQRGLAYVYGTLRKTGWVPSHQKNA